MIPLSAPRETCIPRKPKGEKHGFQTTEINRVNARRLSMLRCLEIEFLSLSASCVAVSSISAPLSNVCSNLADNNSGKFRLRCGCPRPKIVKMGFVLESIKLLPAETQDCADDTSLGT
jgi:hypothetical protein